MGDDDQFSSRGDYGNVVVLFGFQTPEEHAQRAGMLSYLLRGLGQKPSRLRVASLGNTSIVAGVSRLVHAWRQPKITGGHMQARASKAQQVWAERQLSLRGRASTGWAVAGDQIKKRVR